MRILITGSRKWDLMESISARITEAIINYVEDNPHLKSKPIDWVHIVHGGNPRGADFLADKFGRHVLMLPDANIEVYEADWAQFGKSAGFRRNRRMVNSMPTMCLAFMRDNSPGTTDCRNQAKRAGIPTETFKYEDELDKYGIPSVGS
jgi:hypothetical protein